MALAAVATANSRQRIRLASDEELRSVMLGHSSICGAIVAVGGRGVNSMV
jgi:hypothetical protein